MLAALCCAVCDAFGRDALCGVLGYWGLGFVLDLLTWCCLDAG